MKGLLRNNFYSMSTNIQVSFGISLLLGFVPLLTGEENLIAMILGMQSFMFIANIGTALSTDITSKWSNFEITLPVRRNDIVSSRYISFITLILCGILMSTLTSILTCFVFKTINLDAIIFGFTFGISLSLITSSLMYPIMLKIGTSKNEIIVFVCAGIAVGLLLIVFKIAAPLLPDSFMIGRTSLIGIIFTLISIGLFALSYFISLAIYKTKEL